MSGSSPPGLDDLTSRRSVRWMVGGAGIGAALAVTALPQAGPALVASLTGSQPRSWWQLSRATGLASYALLSISMLLGLLLSTRSAKAWPGNATAFALHQHTSLLGLACGALHALALLGDRHTPFRLAELVLPFGAAYRPLALGMGQLALYGMALLVGSFTVRKRIGQRAWRWIHFASFLVFALAWLHGLAAGTDRGAILLGAAPAASVLFLTVYRVLTHVADRTNGAGAPSREETASKSGNRAVWPLLQTRVAEARAGSKGVAR